MSRATVRDECSPDRLQVVQGVRYVLAQERSVADGLLVEADLKGDDGRGCHHLKKNPGATVSFIPAPSHGVKPIITRRISGTVSTLLNKQTSSKTFAVPTLEV